jgi:hypothetical protein
MIGRYVLAWLPMVLIAILNGALRESWYRKFLGELHAHQLSTLTGAVLFAVYIWALSRLWPLASGRQALAVGVIWLAMTVCFEWLFGHFVAGPSWRRLLQDYNICAGRVWVMLLLWVTVAPYVFYRVQR